MRPASPPFAGRIALAALLGAALALGAAAQGAARSGTALIITGAAARIPQEAALLQALDERGLLKDLVFISGDSSGALNAVALNAIHSGAMSWARYRQILSGMRNEDIFRRSGTSIPVDTAPLRSLLARVVEGEMGFKRIGQLPVATSISVTRLEDLGLEKTAYRLCSLPINLESDPSLSIVDILMASTAFPIVFPAVRIAGATTIPDIDYVDGGAGEDLLPFEALLQFEAYRGRGVERVYIISRKDDAVPEISEELKNLGVNDHGAFDKLGISFDAIASRKLLKHLRIYEKRAPELASRSFVWKPDYAGSFLLFDFGQLEAQYAATEAWASLNAPMPLEAYIAVHERKRQ
jgi:predicted acylesterase/phospholipase RssA